MKLINHNFPLYLLVFGHDIILKGNWKERNLMVKIFLGLFIYSHLCFAEDREPHKSVQISIGYFSGQYLIYDCKRASFICVDEYGFQDCQASRDNAIRVSQASLPCAPLKKFPHFDDCEIAQYKEIESPKEKVFCKLKTFKSP
jgi:hypothetical protein